MTSNEIRHLYAELVLTVQHTAEHVLTWSTFRRLRNRQARTSHHHKRLEHLGRYEPP